MHTSSTFWYKNAHSSANDIALKCFRSYRPYKETVPCKCIPRYGSTSILFHTLSRTVPKIRMGKVRKELVNAYKHHAIFSCKTCISTGNTDFYKRSVLVSCTRDLKSAKIVFSMSCCCRCPNTQKM